MEQRKKKKKRSGLKTDHWTPRQSQMQNTCSRSFYAPRSSSRDQRDDAQGNPWARDGGWKIWTAVSDSEKDVSGCETTLAKAEAPKIGGAIAELNPSSAWMKRQQPRNRRSPNPAGKRAGGLDFRDQWELYQLLGTDSVKGVSVGLIRLLWEGRPGFNGSQSWWRISDSGFNGESCALTDIVTFSYS